MTEAQFEREKNYGAAVSMLIRIAARDLSLLCAAGRKKISLF